MNLRKEAKGRECQIRIPGVCNGNSETVVLAHLNKKSLFRSGTGTKPDDMFGAHSCSACHDAVDWRVDTEYTAIELEMMFTDGIFRTQNILLSEGKIGETNE